MEREKSIKGKIVLKDLGNPKKIAALPDQISRLELGVLQGIVSGVTVRSNADGEKFTGFTGQFKAIPTDQDRDIIVSDTLFLPPGAFGLLQGALDKAQPGDIVQFAFIVSVHRDTNPQGYAWVMTPIVETEANDPFAQLDQLVAAHRESHVKLVSAESSGKESGAKKKA